jgi:peroxidase
MGDAFDSVIGNYTGYDAKTDPTIANEFVSAGFRFGHGMLQVL